MVNTRKSIGSAAQPSALPISHGRSLAASAFANDEDPLSSVAATFSGVVVMPKATSSPFKRPTLKGVATPEDSASPASYLDDDVSDYETPATSVSVTPAFSAASSTKGGFSARSAGTTIRKRNFDNMDLDGANDVDEVSADAELARVLQEQEYVLADSHGETTHRKKVTNSAARRGRVVALNGSDSESELSDAALSDLSDSQPLSKKRKVSRVAAPQKKVKQALKKVISDSESELSDAAFSDSDNIPLSKKRGGSRISGSQKKVKQVVKKVSKKVSQKVKPVLPKRQARTKARKAIASATEPADGDSALSAPPSDDEDFAAMSDLEHFDGESVDEEDEEDDENAASNIPWQRVNLPNWRRNHEETKKLNRASRERKKLEKAHPEIMTMWDELKAIPKIATEESPQPESINRQLKSFQLEGLNWMIKQEQTKWKGGLLGDEMGMGKTIQAVSLIMSDHPQKNPTLVTVPPVALIQWTNEIKDYTDGKLKVLVYHGTNSKAKNLSLKELKSYDVIMISYAGLESIYRKEVKGWKRGDKIVKEESAIHAIHFHRVILDEAHSIKSRTTGVAKACFAINATYKWCLSGTPVQNRIGEFFSLLRFLEVQPFANYFCKRCSCSALHWSQSEDYRCNHCSHRSLDHVSVFNQEILNPITSGESEGTRKEAMAKLRLLTDHIMLRRMKRDHTSSLELPPKEVVIHREFFGEIERDFSSSIMTNTSRTFDTYVSRGVMLNNYANIFGLIMQMRQVSDHPDLLLRKHADGGQNVLVCCICDDVAEDAIRSKCKHEFCRACAKDYVRSVEGNGGSPDCPRCHIALAIDWEQPEIEQDAEVVKKSSIINRIKMENWTSSTKIEMLVYDLYKLRSKKQTLKSIVFSQFTSMLQLVEWRLRRAGFNTVMLDGTMTPAQRQKSIEHFMNNTDVEVFLVSLKAGGVALNLVEASRVFIVDPWWNPAAEWQSADRCHRIGQRRPCVITRLCIEDSVESRIVMLQEKKAAMIQATVNRDDVALDKLTPEDMQFLFRGS